MSDTIKDFIHKTLEQQPDATFIDLADHEIDDIEPLIDLISQFQGLEELNLSNNLFTHLPADLSSWHSIANINLSNIQIEDFEACVHTLSTLRNLKSLYINLFEESQVDLIMRILPDLEFLNGLPVDREALNESMQSERNLLQQKNRLQVEEIPEEDAEVTVDDQQHEQSSRLLEENSLSALQISQMNEPESQQQIIGQHLDTAELEAIAICYDNIRQMRRRIPNNNDYELGQKFDAALRTMMDNLSIELQKTKSGEMKVRAAVLAKKDLLKLLCESCSHYMEKTDAQGHQVFNDIIKQYDQMIDQCCQVIAAAQGGSPPPQGVQKNQKQQEKQLKESQDEVERLKQMLNKSQQSERKKTQECDTQKRKIRDLELQLQKQSKASYSGQANVQPAREVQRQQQPGQQTQQVLAKSGTGFLRTQTRVLTLKQLKDTISDMYAQKVKFDKKCEDSRAAKETMEQYMYTYLNQKYGLKSLIVEWAASIINGVKTYLREDHEVTLFAKILKNECDEEFRLIQMHVKDTLLQLVKVIYKDKYPLKSEPDVQAYLEQTQNGKVEDWIWTKILDKMYEDQDAESLQDQIRTIIEDRNKQHIIQENKSGRKLTREEINQRILSGHKQLQKHQYADFQKVVLDFQLKEHERFLLKFNQNFKRFDLNQDGVLDESEFRSLVISMGVLQEEVEVEQLLHQVDPFNNQKMTYSEIVALLSSHMMPREEGSTQMIPMLEKFVNQEVVTEGDYDTGNQLEEPEHYEEVDVEEEEVHA